MKELTEEEFLKKLEDMDTDPREVDEEPESDPLVGEPKKGFDFSKELAKIDDDYWRAIWEDLWGRMAIAKKQSPVEKVCIEIEYWPFEDREPKFIEGVLFMLRWPCILVELENGGKWGRTFYVNVHKTGEIYYDYRTVDEIGYPRKTWKKKESP